MEDWEIGGWGIVNGNRGTHVSRVPHHLARSFNTTCTPLESCFFSFVTRGCN